MTSACEELLSILLHSKISSNFSSSARCLSIWFSFCQSSSPSSFQFAGLLQLSLFIPRCCHLVPFSPAFLLFFVFDLRAIPASHETLPSWSLYGVLVTIMHAYLLLEACNQFLSDLTPDPSFFAVLVNRSFFSACFFCASSWQPSSTVTRQRLGQLLLAPFLHLSFFFQPTKKDTALCGLDLKVYHHLRLRDFSFSAGTRNNVVVNLFNSPFALFDLHVEAFSGATTCIRFFWNQRASHATSHGC